MTTHFTVFAAVVAANVVLPRWGGGAPLNPFAKFEKPLLSLRCEGRRENGRKGREKGERGVNGQAKTSPKQISVYAVGCSNKAFDGYIHTRHDHTATSNRAQSHRPHVSLQLCIVLPSPSSSSCLRN